MNIEKINSIFELIKNERIRQDELWGEQNHQLLNNFAFTGNMMCESYAIPSPDIARDRCELHAANGSITWADILLEEVSEVISELDPQKMREELIQVAAVVVQMVEYIDREELNEG